MAPVFMLVPSGNFRQVKKSDCSRLFCLPIKKLIDHKLLRLSSKAFDSPMADYVFVDCRSSSNDFEDQHFLHSVHKTLLHHFELCWSTQTLNNHSTNIEQSQCGSCIQFIKALWHRTWIDFAAGPRISCVAATVVNNVSNKFCSETAGEQSTSVQQPNIDKRIQVYNIEMN
jgi:hypothetical protein